MELTKEYFEQHLDKTLDNFAVKYDLANMATKQDVQNAIDELASIIAETIANPMEERFQKMDLKFEQIDERFDKMDERFEQIDERFIQIDKRFEQIDARFIQIDKRFDKIEIRFQQVDVRFQEIGIRLDSMNGRIGKLEAGGNAAVRIVKLEKDMGKIKGALMLSE